ncbi:TraR/DksA family transcriptional regulator [Bacteroidia bacterium]|jgi:DnaK suppressor protein|nr:TraR/DksA family transcriptional regulator [Bacteroidota bacterium]MDA8930364.1 TraR/DksA family transcriptional regulator [Bacteroidia bacterium]MDB4174035.1 TraR/DksA family transcriptional regulator [Bacteroidia bacterium]
MAETLRYSDADLAEFKEIILKKLASAKEEYDYLRNQIQNKNGTDDTASAYVAIDDGSASQQKESVGQLASRQQKFIHNLETALVRIENKTYGICKVTGKLISRDRLKAVPHTTQSMEAKKNQYK